MTPSQPEATSPPPLPSLTTAPPQPSKPVLLLPVLGLVARLFTFIFLLVSLVLITTNTVTSEDGLGVEYQVKFNDFYAYRYMMATTVIGFAYTLIQSAFDIFKVSTGNRLGGAGFYLVEFYGDKVISYMLATGAAAGFGLTVDLNRVVGNHSFLTDFVNKGNVAAALLLLGFVFSAVSSVFSSLTIQNRG